MSYTVFALKWRPQNFEQIIGQAHIVSTLKNSIQKNRLAHAFLFAGPRGVGKTSTARILAKALNCQEGPTITPCGKCSSCVQITKDRSLDVIEIDGASNTSVDNIRDLRESVKFAPASGRFKVYIIDEVHMLSDSAFNALLKTLEEPPPYVKFIFATTHPHKVIPTIISRCQRFDFRRISVMEIAGQLERIVSSEKLNVDKEVLFAIARASDGALRDAESVLDQLASFSKDRVSLKDVISVLGLVEQEALFEMADKIIHKDAKGALELLNRLIDEGKDSAVFLSNLIEHFRNLMVAKVSKGDAKLIDLPQEACEKLLKQSQAMGLEEIFSAFNILVKTQELSKRLESLRIPLEISIVRLAYDKKGALAAQPAREQEPQKKLREPQPPAPKETPTKEKMPAQSPEEKEGVAGPTDSPLAITLDNVKGAWQHLIDNLSRIKMSVATYLSEGEPLKIKGNTLVISFPKNYLLHKESLERGENKAIIERSLGELLNAKLFIDFMLSSERKEARAGEDNTFIKSALDMFGGRIIKEG
ncbi:MAG: DNA polymerase III subunit gamma/tau [Candidatus Omnitrophica bacterium]|nr:DNA polymerase III subunit gamma/tau [Candidatus Omnitrophota bacterium]